MARQVAKPQDCVFLGAAALSPPHRTVRGGTSESEQMHEPDVEVERAAANARAR